MTDSVFSISEAQETGRQKSVPSFYEAVTFNTLYPHKCELFREKKTKVSPSVALLSPASTCCLQTSITPTRHWQHATRVAWAKPWGGKTESKLQKKKKKIEFMCVKFWPCFQTVSSVLDESLYFPHSCVWLETVGTVASLKKISTPPCFSVHTFKFYLTTFPSGSQKC